MKRNVPVYGDWVAVTDGATNAQITPQVSGYLISQNYQEGSHVHKDQILFQIDPRTFQASLARAKAEMAQSQAQLQLAKINVDRDRPLAESHAIAQSQLDNEVQTELADEASVASQQANVDSADLNLKFTDVRSLVDGIAGQAAVQVGNLVGLTSVLTTVSTIDPIKVYFFISEQEYLEMSARAKSRGKSDLLSSGNTIPLKLTLADGSVYPQMGRIIFVDRSVSSQTGSIKLAAAFDNPSGLLRPGQFGRIRAETNVLKDAILVPQRAVNELQGLFQMYVVDNDNLAHLKTVTLGQQVGPLVVVNNGLDGTEEVVTDGVDKLKDKTKVEPHMTPPATMPADDQSSAAPNDSSAPTTESSPGAN